jgi:glycerophosphoryl diester phosphodiesterase
VSPVEIIAHRGYSARAPENTLPAIELALAHAADGLEFDIQVTADGVPVVIHDETVDRTTDGSGAVAGMELRPLQRLDAGGWFEAGFAGTRIPTLEEVLARTTGRLRRLYPELKGVRSAADVERIASLLTAYHAPPAITVLAFDWTWLRVLRTFDPALAAGFSVEDAAHFDAALGQAASFGNAVVSPAYRLLVERPDRIEAARGAGVELVAWTVNDAEAAKLLVGLGVGRLITDDVALLRAALGWPGDTP